MARGIRICFILLYLFANATFAAGVSEDKKKLIDELVNLTGSNELIELAGAPILDAVKVSLTDRGIEVDDALSELINQETQIILREVLIENPLVRSQTYRMWDKHFKLSELKQLLDFYKSAVGQKTLEKLPEILQASINISISTQEELLFTLQARLMELLEKEGYEVDDFFTPHIESDNQSSALSEEELSLLAAEVCIDDEYLNHPLPVYRAPPEYPYVAQQYAVEGWVELMFNVLEDGTTEDIRVLNSSTGRLFNEAAILAVSLYVYCKGYRAQNRTIRIRFEMEN